MSSNGSINVINQRVKYAWLDEDGEIMSRVIDDLGQALSYGSRWQSKHDNLANTVTRREEELKEKGDKSWYAKRVKEAREALDKHSKTGKAPTILSRIVITTSIETATDVEQQVAQDAIKPEMF